MFVKQSERVGHGWSFHPTQYKKDLQGSISGQLLYPVRRSIQELREHLDRIDSWHKELNEAQDLPERHLGLFAQLANWKKRGMINALTRAIFGKAMSDNPPGPVRDIKVTIGEHAFRFEGSNEGRRGPTRKLTYTATAESQIEITRTFGDFEMIILIAPQSGNVSMNVDGVSLSVWKISDETSRSLEDMLLGLVGKSWEVDDDQDSEDERVEDERVKALHKCAMKVDFWVEPQEERPWKRRKFTDAELVCGNESFEVHRGLLAAKSAVFEAAFESAFQEGVKAKYEIKDASKAAVKGMLYFLYTGNLSVESDETLPDILNLAMQYELYALADKVVPHLAAGIDANNIGLRARLLKRHVEREECKRALDIIVEKAMQEPVLVVDVTPLRKALMAMCACCRLRLMGVVQRWLEDACAKLKLSLQAKSGEIIMSPKQPDELHSTILAVKSLDPFLVETAPVLASIRQMFEVLESRYHQVPRALVKRWYECIHAVPDLRDRAEKWQNIFRKDLRGKFNIRIAEKAKILSAQVQECRLVLEEYACKVSLTKAEFYYNKMHKLQERVAKLQEQVEKQHVHEEMMEMPLSEFPGLAATAEQIAPLLDLWFLAHDWSQWQEEILFGEFVGLPGGASFEQHLWDSKARRTVPSHLEPFAELQFDYLILCVFSLCTSW
eukprot:symbB.v1.2.007697.t1/scaffold468.1/size202162/11